MPVTRLYAAHCCPVGRTGLRASRPCRSAIRHPCELSVTGSGSRQRNRRRGARQPVARPRAGRSQAGARQGHLRLGIRRLGDRARWRVTCGKSRDRRAADSTRRSTDDLLGDDARSTRRRPLVRDHIAGRAASARPARDHAVGAREGGWSARRGGAEYLESLGDADPRYSVEPLNEADQAAVTGTYAFAGAPSDRLIVAMGARGLSIKRDGERAEPVSPRRPGVSPCRRGGRSDQIRKRHAAGRVPGRRGRPVRGQGDARLGD